MNALRIEITVESIIVIISWLGVIFYIMAYLLLSIGRLKPGSPLFHLLNILGATGLITDSAYHQDIPYLAVNVVWLLIGLFAIGKSLLAKSCR
jgi:hypothetical protein